MMIGTRIGTGIAALIGAGISWVGWQYTTAPVATAPSFVGSPDPDPVRFLGNAKGVRDLFFGVAIAGLLATRRRREAGAFMLLASMVPAGDALVVLRNGGSTATALGVHGATAAAGVASGVLLLRG
jgi:hypothetical protein